MFDTKKWYAPVSIIFVIWILYLLTPILTPFILALAAAYLCAPLVDHIESHHRPRVLAVVLVFSLFVLLCTLLVVILVPILETQLMSLISRLPNWIEWFKINMMPEIINALGLDKDTSTLNAIQTAISQNWRQASSIVTSIVSYLSSSGFNMITWVLKILLMFVVTFYLLIDWHVFLDNLRTLIPRRFEKQAVNLAKECNSVLAQFLRGQLMVMFALGSIYTFGLWLIGIDLAVLLGLISGVVSFVPYLGIIVGVSSAGVVAFMQFQTITSVFLVVLVFVVGQLLEGLWLTPKLVGDKIGLHPIAVIFAAMAGGQLFGFLGVLLALPVTAVLVVMITHLKRHYLSSKFYNLT